MPAEKCSNPHEGYLSNTPDPSGEFSVIEGDKYNEILPDNLTDLITLFETEIGGLNTSAIDSDSSGIEVSTKLLNARIRKIDSLGKVERKLEEAVMLILELATNLPSEEEYFYHSEQLQSAGDADDPAMNELLFNIFLKTTHQRHIAKLLAEKAVENYRDEVYDGDISRMPEGKNIDAVENIFEETEPLEDLRVITLASTLSRSNPGNYAINSSAHVVRLIMRERQS